LKSVFALAFIALPFAALAQDTIPSPYGPPQHQWASPATGAWGSTAGIERGPRGEIWAIDRCGANSCDGSDHAPIVQLDLATGKPIKSIGAGLFVFPHGLHVDRRGNVWVTDGAISKDGTKGLQVTQLSPDGKVLMQLGVAGQRGNDETHFQSPSDVITAPNGDIFVTDGHAPIQPFIPANLNMRVMKFDSHGKFLIQWGKAGTRYSEFNNPHALGLDSAGRLYVADRGNNRIQIFSQDGKFTTEWKQFGRPSGFYITGDRLYAIDADSVEANHPGGWKKGVWIGSISQAKAEAFVPDEQAGEGVVVAPDGNMYGAVNVAPRGITKYPKQASREKRS
jgi:DNA-binding beta-propeller fold protein YncE